MTPQREQKIQQVLSNRQHDLTVIFENIDDPHNISACLRSCDAVGIAEVYILSTRDKKQSKLGKKSSASASKWLTIHHHFTVEDCFNEVKKKYSRIYSTLLAPSSVNLYDMNFRQSIALVFGNEHEGVSSEAAAHCDGNLIIPQVGMIQSLNISVACAVTLYEAFRQRRLSGYFKS
jgi:tRNA (guanosine-2'-O-)-methyltransferase